MKYHSNQIKLEKKTKQRDREKKNIYARRKGEKSQEGKKKFLFL